MRIGVPIKSWTSKQSTVVMISKYSITENEKRYFAISGGNAKISIKSIESALIKISEECGIDYHSIKYDVDWMYSKAVTFIGCYNAEMDEKLWVLPDKKYANLRFIREKVDDGMVKRIVCNSVILCMMNRDRIEDIKRMRYYILQIIHMYSFKSISGDVWSDMMLNEIIEECCMKLKSMIEDGTVESEAFEQSKKNCRYVTVTKGSGLSAKEKQSLSAKHKFSDEEKDYVLFLINVDRLSYRAAAKAFEEKYEKHISVKTIQNIISKYNGY